MVDQAVVPDPFGKGSVQLWKFVSVIAPKGKKNFGGGACVNALTKINDLIDQQMDIADTGFWIGFVSNTLAPPKIPIQLTAIELGILGHIGKEW